MAKGYPVILFLDFCPVLVKVVYIFLGVDEPVFDLDLVLVGDDDPAGREGAVDEVVLMEGGEALDDGAEGVADLRFIEVEDVVAALPVVDLGLERGLLLGVEESVVVADGPEEGGVRDAALGVGVGQALEVLIGLLGGLV